MRILKLRNLEKSRFNKRLKNNKTDEKPTQRKEIRESFAEVLEREKGKLREE